MREDGIAIAKEEMDGEDVEQLKFIVSDTAQAAPGQMLEHYSTSSVNFTEVLVAYCCINFMQDWHPYLF